jgi:SNF2 family DNA or RNA helicase
MSTIELTGEWAKSHMGRAVPGSFFDRERQKWVIQDPTPRAAAVALRLFPELANDNPELEEARDLLAQDVRPFDNATPFDTHVTASNVRAELERELKSFYEFQSIDLGYMGAVLQAHGGAYIGWERGLGKTLAACALIDDLECRRTLVVCPNTAKESVWGAELQRWLPGHDVWVLPNDKPRRDRMLRQLHDRESERPLVLVSHYEALAIVAGKEKVKRNTRIGKGWDRYGQWDMVVADEVHRIANPDSQMSKALKKVPARYKLGLSGSIIQNHAEELFSPLQWLFPERYRSKWRDWNDRFLDYVDGNFSRICIGIKLENLNELRKELGVFMVYRRKEDELDLPDFTEQTLLVDLSPAQRKAYNELVTTCATQLEDGTQLKRQDGLAMLGALRQLATGLDLVSHDVADSTKLDLAVEMIEDNPDEAFVVFSWYKAAGRKLAERLTAKGIECFVVDGDVKQEVRAEYIERFQAGEGQVFIGTLSTLSESVTLHRASNAIFLDRSWNPATNVQAADRIYRIGQTKPVTVTHIVARNTVDELRVLPTIANKEALRRLILGGK